MAEQNKPKAAAYSILRRLKATRLSLDDLVGIAREQNYSILDYSNSANNRSTETLIQELGLLSFAQNSKSFVYKNRDIKLIFLCETMNVKEKIYALAHELGHVFCGHLNNHVCCNESNMEEEQEANEFAHYLLHPTWYAKTVISVYKHKVLAIVSAIVLILGIISFPVIRQIKLSKSYYGEYYVTDNGEKYHVADCPVIKDKTNTHRLTNEEYESEKYEPCQICLPDGPN